MGGGGSQERLSSGEGFFAFSVTFQDTWTVLSCLAGRKYLPGRE